MEKIIVKCYFTNSEEFIAKVAVKEGWPRWISIRKVIDPLSIVTGRYDTLVDAEQYEFYGKREYIEKIRNFFTNGEYDVEVI